MEPNVPLPSPLTRRNILRVGLAHATCLASASHMVHAHPLPTNPFAPMEDIFYTAIRHAKKPGAVAATGPEGRKGRHGVSGQRALTPKVEALTPSLIHI